MSYERDLAAELRALPQPAPPPGLAAGVLARIAQIEATRPVESTVVRVETRARVRDWSLWPNLAGLAAGAAMVVPSHATSMKVAPLNSVAASAALAAMPATTMGLVALAVGLALYVGALFLPVSSKRQV